METIYFITSNPGKIASARAILQEVDVSVVIEPLAATYPEDKSELTTEYIAGEGARWCANRYNKPVLVTDVGLFIKDLKGFPGVNTAFTIDRIGVAGLLKVLAGAVDRRADWTLSLAFAQPNDRPIVFTHSLSGTIADQPRGNSGFGFDPIFIPEHADKTLAEDLAARDQRGPFRAALIDFASWYQSGKTV